LHSYWDNRLVPGHKPGWNTDARARVLATGIEATNSPGVFPLMKTDPKSWALESFATREFVYSPPLAPTQTPGTAPKHLISPTYAKDSRKLADKRIALAGYRLAKMLNRVFGKP
jgi:hypothetical protein